MKEKEDIMLQTVSQSVRTEQRHRLGHLAWSLLLLLLLLLSFYSANQRSR